MSYHTNIIYDTTQNKNFRVVLNTGKQTQLVIMCIPPGGEIGMETHERVEQTLFFLTGNGIAVLDGVSQPIDRGDVLVITPGTEHNIVNTGTEEMKIYTIYSPPNHLDGRVHATKEDAALDEDDEAFSDSVNRIEAFV